jgi:hypothetical protein
MPTSGITSYAPVTDDILTEAYERCGLSPATLNADVARSARRSLQLMLLDWANRSVQLWRVERQATATISGQATYATPDGTVDVLEVILSVDDADYVLAPQGRDQWAALSRKSTMGRPTQYWAERRRDAVVLHLWPVPDDTYRLAVNRFRLPEDVGSLSQSADVPVMWSEALAAGLASRLAMKYKPDRFQMLKALAEEAFTNATGEDRERVPLTILPDLGWR